MSNKKQLLSEATIRRFASLAKIDNISAKRVQQLATENVTEGPLYQRDEEELDLEAPPPGEEVEGAELDVEEGPGGEEMEFEEFEEEGDLGGSDEEGVAQELAAELLSDDAVVDAVGAALAALGDVTRDGAPSELADEQEAMGELEGGMEGGMEGAELALGDEGDEGGEGEEEEEIEIEKEPLEESLVNEIALRVARRLLKRK